MKKIILSLFISLLVGTNLIAIEKNKIKETVNNNVKEILLTLKNDIDNNDLKKEKIILSINRLFDFNLMSRLVVGKKYWKLMDDNQKTLYSKTFKDMIKNFYYRKFKSYTDQKFKIISLKEIKLNKRIQLDSKILESNTNYDIIFKLYNSKGDWRIYDIKIEGVSIVKIYQKQIRRLFNRSFKKEFYTIISEIKKVNNRS